MSAQNSKQQRVPGRPWKKGQSGNPGGRRKEYPAFKERMAQLISSEWVEEEIEWLARQRKDLRAKGFALRLAAEYGIGKPVQPIAGEMKHSGRVQVEFISDWRDGR